MKLIGKSIETNLYSNNIWTLSAQNSFSSSFSRAYWYSKAQIWLVNVLPLMSCLLSFRQICLLVVCETQVAVPPAGSKLIVHVCSGEVICDHGFLVETVNEARIMANNGVPFVLNLSNRLWCMHENRSFPL